MTVPLHTKTSSIVPYARSSDANDSAGRALAIVESYLAAYVEQTPIVRLKPGDLTVARIWVKNIGTATWRNDREHPVMLGTDKPLDRPGLLFAPSAWLTSSRIAKLVERQVAPGETGTFHVALQAPAAPGRYREWIRPVAENLDWFNDLDLCFTIDVVPDVNQTGPLLAAELLEQPAPLLLPPNGRGVVRLRFRNVGRMRWSHRGEEYGPHVMLGLYDVSVTQARYFDQDSWATTRRPVIVKGFVLPGETTDLLFTVRAPAEPGSYMESYALVAEGLAWFTGPIGIRVIVP